MTVEVIQNSPLSNVPKLCLWLGTLLDTSAVEESSLSCFRDIL